MALINEDRYRALSHDEDSYHDDVDNALNDSQAALEEWLERPLTQQTITEQLTIYGDYVFPGVTPLVSVDPAYTIEGNAIRGVVPDPTHMFSFLSWKPYMDWARQAMVTYTGGFTSSNLPAYLQRAIAEGAQSLLRPVSSLQPGTTSVRLGDAAVTYDADGARTSVAGNLFSVPTLRTVSKWKRRNI